VEGNIGADYPNKPAPFLTPYLGHFLTVRYSCHTKQAVLIECGRDWALFDDGGMVHTPSISSITHERKQLPRENIANLLPDNLGDLFK